MTKINQFSSEAKQKVNISNTPIDGPPGLDMIENSPIYSEKNHDEIRENSSKFQSLVDKSSHVLFRAYTVFPFTFFPHSVVIDENKVNIIHRMFFSSEEIQSILIHHIKDVIADTSLFFGTLKILPEGFNENWVSVSFLKRNDAIRARRIIAGLLVGFKEGVDMTKVETQHLKQKIEAVGTVSV